MIEDQKLKIVLNRDKSHDGQFFYGVITTGVCCKPSCTSRHARPENIRFFDTLAAALKQGFRPCRKCKPDQLDHKGHSQLIAAAITEMEAAVQENDGQKITLMEIAEKLSCSSDHLSRVFRKNLQIGPLDYFELLRTKAFKSRLKDGEAIASAAYGSGYGSLSRVYEKATDNLGMSPASYAKGGKGADIAYVIVDCFLGRMLAAGTHHGICAIYFGSDDRALLAELREEFPKADIGREIGDLQDWVSVILSFLERGDDDVPNLPLDMYGTAFQRRVWQELLKIAPGQIRTYQDIAKDLGNGKASRAVGRACATNPVSLIVPCHRVVGSDGKLHGYRWGLPRKEALQQWERRS